MSTHPSMLGSYPVERELGRGGMGVVYLGRDVRLDRHVAIKVLPDLLSLTPDSLARFGREAKLLASLNHPNIAAIYGIEEVDRQQLLVLEYVPGDTLAARIGRGALPMDEALDVCRQIALAIEAAHEGGVIHRDLKPGNVKVTPDGQVKVLDFGLAKAGSVSTSSGAGADPASVRQMATMTSPAMTAMGIILGTAGYMSPEQARGKIVDKRTDIWSFGCVLFECLTGRQPFEGETVSDTIAKILEREPDWAVLPSNTPSRIRELLRRCLERDAKKRQRDIGDVRIELEEAIAARASSSRSAPAIARPPARAWHSARTLALATTCVLVGAAAGIGVWTRVAGRGVSSAIAGTRRVSMEIPRSIRGLYAVFTVDGRSVLLAGNPRKPDGTEDPRARIYTRRLDDYEFKPIAGTEGARSFTTSPDGRWLAVVLTISEQSSKRRLMKVPVDGSAPPVTIADWDDSWNNGIEWLEDDNLVIITAGQRTFVRQPSRGGPASPPIAIDTGDTSGFVTLGNRLPGNGGVFLSMETWGPRGFQFDQWVMDPKTGKAHRVLENSESAAYASTGHIVFQRADVLMAAPFDLDTLAVTGEVTAVFAGVRAPDGGFSLASDGTVIYSPGGVLGTDRRIVTVDAKGTVAPFIAERREYENESATSRDGRKIAVVVGDEKGTYEIWLGDLDRPGLKRVVALPNADCAEPVWAPDGQRIAFMRMGSDDNDGVYVQRVDGEGPPQLIAKTGSREVKLTPTSWRPDGSGLLMTRRSNGKNAIVFVPVPTGGVPGPLRLIREVNYSEHSARASPDGRLVAFASYESGKSEVYVAPFGTDGSFGPRVLVSSAGGGEPAWASSTSLFYVKGPGTLMSTTIATRPTLSASAPVAAHDFKKLRLRSSGWDILPDGRLVATQSGEGEDDVTSYNVVFNWFDELRARMGKSTVIRP